MSGRCQAAFLAGFCPPCAWYFRAGRRRRPLRVCGRSCCGPGEVFADCIRRVSRRDGALAHAKRTRQTLAVLCLDLDHFKSVNGTLGYPLGDKLLQAIAARPGSLREIDFAARLGGATSSMSSERRPIQAKSAILLYGSSKCSAPFTIDGHHVVVGASIGIAVWAPDGRMCSPTMSRLPSVMTATAIFAATETMRPPSRIFR